MTLGTNREKMTPPPGYSASLTCRTCRNWRMFAAGHEALQLLPRLQIAKLGHGRQLLVMQHEHAFHHGLLPLEQQTRLTALDALDTRVERSLGVPVGFEIRAAGGLAPHEICEIDEADQAAELVEIAAARADRRQREMVFQRERAHLGTRKRQQHLFRACRPPGLG
ncbi:hypothetical protein Y048_5996 [Burkholderia pseudomallei MSHR456]|nr:hypothetical protein Y048_5996 [Burkholderia pseudomallei MSHR456]